MNHCVHPNRHCSNYRIFKDDLQFETYLCSLNDKDRINLCQFRCRSTKLPISTSFVYNIDNETCKLCDLNEPGDEFHYILKCPYFSNDRKKLLKIDCKRVNCLKLKKIFMCKSTSKLKSLAGLIKLILSNCIPSINARDKDKKTSTNTSAYLPKLKTRSGRITQKPTVLDL